MAVSLDSEATHSERQLTGKRQNRRQVQPARVVPHCWIKQSGKQALQVLQECSSRSQGPPCAMSDLVLYDPSIFPDSMGVEGSDLVACRIDEAGHQVYNVPPWCKYCADLAATHPGVPPGPQRAEG